MPRMRELKYGMESGDQSQSHLLLLFLFKISLSLEITFTSELLFVLKYLFKSSALILGSKFELFQIEGGVIFLSYLCWLTQVVKLSSDPCDSIWNEDNNHDDHGDDDDHGDNDDHGDEGDQSDVILFDSVTLTDNKLASEAGNAQII